MRPGHVPYHPSRRVSRILQSGNEGGGVKKEKEHDYGHPLERCIGVRQKHQLGMPPSRLLGVLTDGLSVQPTTACLDLDRFVLDSIGIS